jgi:hypothetical protein
MCKPILTPHTHTARSSSIGWAPSCLFYSLRRRSRTRSRCLLSYNHHHHHHHHHHHFFHYYPHTPTSRHLPVRIAAGQSGPGAGAQGGSRLPRCRGHEPQLLGRRRTLPVSASRGHPSPHPCPSTARHAPSPRVSHDATTHVQCRAWLLPSPPVSAKCLLELCTAFRITLDQPEVLSRTHFSRRCHTSPSISFTRLLRLAEGGPGIAPHHCSPIPGGHAVCPSRSTTQHAI